MDDNEKTSDAESQVWLDCNAEPVSRPKFSFAFMAALDAVSAMGKLRLVERIEP